MNVGLFQGERTGFPFSSLQFSRGSTAFGRRCYRRRRRRGYCRRRRRFHVGSGRRVVALFAGLGVFYNDDVIGSFSLWCDLGWKNGLPLSVLFCLVWYFQVSQRPNKNNKIDYQKVSRPTSTSWSMTINDCFLCQIDISTKEREKNQARIRDLIPNWGFLLLLFLQSSFLVIGYRQIELSSKTPEEKDGQTEKIRI